MRTDLLPGDVVVYRSKRGLRLKATVADTLHVKARGEALLVPIQRCTAIVWKPRDELRKVIERTAAKWRAKSPRRQPRSREKRPAIAQKPALDAPLLPGLDEHTPAKRRARKRKAKP